MDLGTHLATGLIVSTVVEEPTAKVLCIVGSIAPDFIFAPYYTYRIFKKDWKFWQHMKKNGPEPHHPQWEMKTYYFAHSFVCLGILFLIASLLQSYVLWGFFLGYASHVLWDIPTHSGKWAHRPLYPFVDWKINGSYNWWKHTTTRRLVVAGWGFLLSVYFLINSGYASFHGLF